MGWIGDGFIVLQADGACLFVPLLFAVYSFQSAPSDYHAAPPPGILPDHQLLCSTDPTLLSSPSPFKHQCPAPCPDIVDRKSFLCCSLSANHGSTSYVYKQYPAHSYIASGNL